MSEAARIEFFRESIATMTAEAAEWERLPMWVIYDHPTDFPADYVARLWHSTPTPEPTDRLVSARDVDVLRQALIAIGYTCLARSPNDDPKIIETWL